MKIHYSKILLFSLPLNILAHSKNKQYITPQTPTTTSRVLNECDINTSIYDNNEDMKSVKENFDRQTSQRLDEYEERMIDKRKKCKEQRDKDIQKIILKDKMEKSLAQKMEKGCLRCGFGLGGVAAGVGIFGAIAVNEWTKAALVAANQKGIDAGIAKAIKVVISQFGLEKLNGVILEKSITANNFNSTMFYIEAVQDRYNSIVCVENPIDDSGVLCYLKETLIHDVKVTKSIAASAQKIVAEATEEVTLVTKAEISATEAASYNMYSAIGYSVTAILIIVLVMLIIYLILRYRRKTKMNKKQQYTKLLKE
ncbi:hypothetical protein PFTANZ_00016 [Plasmodium falciparum Tanzania (2000708)]|uniref:Surface antigen n=1 Tax=Plasmodium falciparum Tanzania (2000708) TaxID=1036725 RepID=A0A024WF31_PLAFA|nr:hypothetical protein PFTANZ_00016 [Plasmodium falciparum Tanzania (2000708)]